MPTKVLQFPDLGDIFLNQLPATLGNLLDFIRALGSLLGILGLIISIIMFFGRDYIGGNPTKILAISVILLIICGPDSGIRYFRLI